MSAIEEVIGALKGAIDELEDGLGHTRDAGESAEKGLGAAQVAGSGAAIEGYNQLTDELAKLAEQLSAAKDTSETALSIANAIAEST